MSKLIVPLIFILVSIAIVAMLIVPAWQHFLTVQADSRHLQEINGEIDTLTQKRDALNEQISKITRDKLDRLDQMIPSVIHSPEFLVSLEQTAEAHGLRVTKLDLSSALTTKSKIPSASNSSSRAAPGVAAKSTVPGTAGANPGIAAGTIPAKNIFQPNLNLSDSGAAAREGKPANYQTINVNMEVAGSYEAFKDFLHELESFIRITDVESLNFSSNSGGFTFRLGLKTYYQ